MGRLDVRNPSLWAVSAPGRPRPPLDGPLDVDVCVVGAGITGMTTALLLAEDGARVAVLEAGQVAAGTTGFTTAKVTSLHSLTYASLVRRHGEDKARQYGAANQAALDHIRQVVERLGIDCDLERRAAYTYTAEASSVPDIEAEVDAATRLGLPASLVTETPLPYHVAAAIRFDDQAQLHPRRYTLALADALDAAGGVLAEDTRALDVDESDGRVTVRTDRGDVTADRVVLATLLPFTDIGGFFAKAHPTRSYALAVTIDGEAPDGMFLGIDDPTRSVRPVPLDGEIGLVVSGGGHKTGEGDEAAQYADLETWVRATFPVRDIQHRWSAQDYVPVDGAPYVGLSPRRSRTYVATGFKKWGMTNGTAAAMILADTLAGRQNQWADVFDARRVGPTAASARKLLGENLDVARHFVVGHAERLRAAGADRLGPGEGGVVDLDGQKVAAYRDDSGALHAVSAVCTHLGCTVAFNRAERTWDCPCHGSRFAPDGEPLEGPAVRPLRPIAPKPEEEQ